MAETVYLCGPPGSGKTARLYEECVAATRDRGCDVVLWLAPDAATAAGVRERLTSELGGLFDPRILTFPDLARALLDANHQAVKPLSPVQRRLLAAGLAADPKVAFPPTLAARPGFVAALCSFVDELKRAAIYPADFTAAADRLFRGDHRARSVAAFYTAYQELLEGRELFDEPGLFWWARSLLANGKRAPFEEVKLVLVDGFADFTTTQLQVLHHLAIHSDRTVVTLDLSPGAEDGQTIADERAELFALPRRTLQRLRAEVGPGRTLWLETGSERRPALQHLLDNTFRLLPADRPHPRQRVQVLAAPGVMAEAREVLREIKGLLLSGARPEQIAIVVRSLDSYRQALQEAASELGVPLAVGGREPLGQRPSVQVVLDLLQVEAGDYRQADVVKLLKSNFIDDAALQTPDQEISAEDFERLACEARVIGGRESWERQLDLYSRRLQRWQQVADQETDEEQEGTEPVSSPEAIIRDLQLAGRCRQLLHNLAAGLAPLVQTQTRAAHVQALLGLIRHLGISERLVHPQACGDSATNLAAFEAFVRALVELATADNLLGEPGGSAQTIDFHDFAAEVQALCTDTSYSLPLRAEGRVVASQAEQARQLRRPCLFVCGLVEGQWPRVWREQPFFDDRERAALNRAGLSLDLSYERQREEAYLFYLACAAAEKRLYLTYPTVDSEGQELLRSHYVDEVAAVFAKNSLESRSRKLSDVVVEASQAACPDEFLERVVHDHLQGEFDLLALLPAHGRKIAHALTCAAVEQQRDSFDPCEQHDGVLAAAEIHQALARRFSADYPWSATALGQYGRCPFAFLARRVWRLDTVEMPTEEVESLERGLVVHRILSRFFTRWREGRPGQPLTAADNDEARALMGDMVDRVFAAWERAGLVGHSALWRMTRDEVRQDLLDLVDYEIEKIGKEGLAPAAFEAEYKTLLPAAGGEEPLRIRGMIDRVEVAPASVGEGREFAVYDYKSGDGPSPTAITEGTDFQMPFYALGALVTDYGGGPPPRQCQRWAYYRVRRPIGLSKVVEREPNRFYLGLEEYITQATAHAREHVVSIRQGVFPVCPRQCSSFCDFAGICRFTPSRAERKGGQANHEPTSTPR